MRLALFEPEIPQNTGTLLRLAACLGVGVDLIEPCGFVLDDKKLRRAGMDYVALASLTRHDSWASFFHAVCSLNHRIVLLETDAPTSFLDFSFLPTDVLLLGKESSGVPEHIARTLAHQVHIPMRSVCRSLNMALAGGMVLSEAMRQNRLFPKKEDENE